MSFSIEHILRHTDISQSPFVTAACSGKSYAKKLNEVQDVYVNSPSTSPSTSSPRQHEPQLNSAPRTIRSRPSRSYAESPDSDLQKEKPDKRHRRDYAKGYRKCQRAKVSECQELKQRIQQLEQQIKSRCKDLKNAKNQLKQLNTYIDSIIQLKNKA